MKAGEIAPHNLSLLHLLSQLNQQVSAVPQIATSAPVSEPVPTAAAPPAVDPNVVSTLQSLQALQNLVSTSAPPTLQPGLQPGSPATALTLALQQVALLQQQPNVLQEVLQSLLRDILLTQSASLLHQPKPPVPPAWPANGGEAKPTENTLELFAGPTSQPEQSNQ